MNLTLSPFKWSNAYVSKEYTCLWHVLKNDDENRIVSYMQEYRPLIQSVNNYNFIDIDGEKERFYAENDAILANTLLLYLLYIEFKLFTDGYSIPNCLLPDIASIQWLDDNMKKMCKNEQVKIIDKKYHDLHRKRCLAFKDTIYIREDWKVSFCEMLMDYSAQGVHVLVHVKMAVNQPFYHNGGIKTL